MLNRTPVIKLLVASGLLSVAAFAALTRSEVYVPGSSYEVHPPATKDREAAADTLEQLGWSHSTAQGESIFVPELDPGASVGLGARLSHQSLPPDETTTVHAAVALRARSTAASESAKSNVALVIDRSGSMAGFKLDYARAASHTLIDALGPRDRLSIVTYGSDVTVVATPTPVIESRAALHRAVDAIRADGGTNLSGGFEAALELLQKSRDGDSIERIVLLSDGQANEGIVDIDELGGLASGALEHGVSVTTMGMGLDYDEDVLQRMATRGAGNYYFIDDVASTDRVFARELSRLKGAVARNARLRVSLSPGVQLVELRGFAWHREGDLVLVELDTLTAGDQKDLLVELKVDPQTDHGALPIARLTLDYTDVATAQAVQIEQTPTVVLAGGAPRTDPTILRRVQQIRTAESFTSAMERYDAGDRDRAAAIIDQQKADNLQFLDKYDIDDPAFHRVDEELEKLAEALRRTDRHTTEGKWLSKSTKFRSANVVQSSIVF